MVELYLTKKQKADKPLVSFNEKYHEKIVLISVVVLIIHNLYAQPDEILVLKTENSSYSNNFKLQVSVTRDTIMIHDTMVIHQIGSFINVESDIAGQLRDTNFYAPVRYVFLDFKNGQDRNTVPWQQKQCLTASLIFPVNTAFVVRLTGTTGMVLQKTLHTLKCYMMSAMKMAQSKR